MMRVLTKKKKDKELGHFVELDTNEFVHSPVEMNQCHSTEYLFSTRGEI